jgi:hypothetical protein
MIHFRIIASIWVLFGAVGALACARDALGLSSGEEFDGGAVASLLLALPFCLSTVVIGLGLYRARRWAVICTRFVAALFLLYCLSFVLMSHFSFAWAGLIGVAFAVYSLYIVWKSNPREHAT